MKTLADALPDEIRRINEVVIPAYLEILPTVPMAALTLTMIRATVDLATRACSEGDVVAMMGWLEELRGIKA